VGCLADETGPRTRIEGALTLFHQLVILADFYDKLLILKDMGKRRERPEEDLELFEQIREANSVAGMQFLEYLVLQKRSTVCYVLLNFGMPYSFLIPFSVVTRTPYTTCYVMH
jgi:hypothetical protein